MLVLKKINFFVISWLNFHDDFTRESIEYNFFWNERNSWFVNEFDWLIDYLIDLQTLEEREILTSSRKIKEWCELIDRFYDLLITLIQWIWDQNARELEFLNICE